MEILICLKSNYDRLCCHEHSVDCFVFGLYHFHFLAENLECSVLIMIRRILALIFFFIGMVLVLLTVFLSIYGQVKQLNSSFDTFIIVVYKNCLSGMEIIINLNETQLIIISYKYVKDAGSICSRFTS